MSDLMNSAGWLSIKEQIRTTMAVHTWKAVHLSKPERLTNKLNIMDNFKIVVPPPPRLQFTRSCYKWWAAEQWNKLDLDMRQENSISRFNKRIKRQVIDDRSQDPDVPEDPG